MIGETLATIAQVALLTFVVTSMAAMGLSLMVRSIVGPLRDVRLVGSLLLVNFVAVPVVAVAAARLLPMGDATGTAIILVGCCAGAPILPKLAQLAKGDAGLAVGAMVLLMVATVLYAPIVVPLVVEGATVDPWEIASSLIVLMLIPLGIGLAVRARYEQLALEWAERASQASSVALMLAIGAALLVSWREVVGAVGSWVFIGTAIVLVAGLAAGALAGWGRSRRHASVLSLATGQRNISAALVIATPFGGDILVLTLVAALSLQIALLVVAGELGKRSGTAPRQVRP